MRIGVDLGGTKVEGIRLKDNGQIDKKIRVSTPTKNYDSVITLICDLISDLQTPDRLSVGIGTPGTLDPQTEAQSEEAGQEESPLERGTGG